MDHEFTRKLLPSDHSSAASPADFQSLDLRYPESAFWYSKKKRSGKRKTIKYYGWEALRLIECPTIFRTVERRLSPTSESFMGRSLILLLFTCFGHEDILGKQEG